MTERWTDATDELVAETLSRFVGATFLPSDCDSGAVAVLTALADAGLLVPPGPRVWAMPTIPDDVKAVRDREGFVWRRGGTAATPDVWYRSTGAWSVGGPKWIALIGPLTEVDGSPA